MLPTMQEELALIEAGHTLVAGIDEAGRGCWAGPVVAAAVLVDRVALERLARLGGVNDSKQVSRRRRSLLAERIRACVTGWGIGAVPSFVIDTHGILNATRAAMQIALLQLPILPHALLIDAVQLHGWPCPQRALIRGDSQCLAIAAASILAKVARDSMMEQLNQAMPAYHFQIHHGYGTQLHEQALYQHGPCSQHRRTFRPLATFLQDGSWPPRNRTGSGRIAQPLLSEEYYDD